MDMKSSFCHDGGCVTVMFGNGVTVIDEQGNHVRFTDAEWDAFVKGVKAGEFDGE